MYHNNYLLIIDLIPSSTTCIMFLALAEIVSIQIFIMIDLIQWRVCIGMWCCHINSVKRKTRFVNNIQSHPRVKHYHLENENLGLCMNILRALLSHTCVLLYTLTVCIFLQLIVSGDVESNPGPVG